MVVIKTVQVINCMCTSYNVCLKSLANVDVSCKSRCCSTRSFCHASSILAFKPVNLVLPEFINRSSSN